MPNRAVGARVQTMPNEVHVWFTERVEPGVSSIKVFDATGKQIDKRDVHADPKKQGFAAGLIACPRAGNLQGDLASGLGGHSRYKRRLHIPVFA